jgi:DNA-binding NarL/FixJ family response regulator
MKALIVDDERIARLELRRLLAAHPEIEIVGEARNGEEALAAITRPSPDQAPDIVFLDIQMPGMTGFDLLDRMEDVPQIIFTTAYDEYAVKAFEVNALDYLMKPIAPDRLAAALRKVRTVLDRSRAGDLFARVGRQLHTAVFRERTSDDCAVADSAGATARPDGIFSRRAKAHRQSEVDRPGGAGRRGQSGGHAEDRTNGGDVTAAVGAIEGSDEPVICHANCAVTGQRRAGISVYRS